MVPHIRRWFRALFRRFMWRIVWMFALLGLRTWTHDDGAMHKQA
jgi:hypothetical protein